MRFNFEKYRSKRIAVINYIRLAESCRVLIGRCAPAILQPTIGLRWATLVETDSFHPTALTLIIVTPVTSSEIRIVWATRTKLGQLGIDETTDVILAPSVYLELKKQTNRTARRILLGTIG
jgi:hypothetical protein